MTATFTAERRRPPPTPPRPLRELPVLFHLMDVSRPKGYAAPPPPAFRLDSLDKETGSPAAIAIGEPDRSVLTSTLPPELASQPALSAAESFDLETAAELVQTKAYGSLPSEMAPSAEPTSAESSAQRSDVAGVHPETEPADSISSLEMTPRAGEDAVTPRQRAEERQRKRQEGKKDDWFSSQGKYIVIGFFIALVVTIYVARSGKKPVAAPVAAKPHAKTGVTAGTATASAVKPAAAVDSAKITSVRPTEKTAAASEPKTALHPPTIPRLDDQPATTSSPADATLFTFTRRTEERVAARSDAVAAPTADPPAASPTSTSSSTDGAFSAATTPSLQPSYPSTNYPGTYQPIAPAPSTAPSPGVYAPIPPAPAGPALGPAASATPLYPTTNTASGYRYERTGSSVY